MNSKLDGAHIEEQSLDVDVLTDLCWYQVHDDTVESGQITPCVQSLELRIEAEKTKKKVKIKSDDIERRRTREEQGGRFVQDAIVDEKLAIAKQTSLDVDANARAAPL